jgi:hypothetical protein
MQLSGEIRLPPPATCRCLPRRRHHPCRVDIPHWGPASKERRALVLGSSPTGCIRPAPIGRALSRAIYAGSSRCDRLDQARVVVFDAAHARAHRPARHLFRRIGREQVSWRAGHSMTSSARARIEGGTVRPSAWAVFRLTTSSNLVGCCTGRSAGFAPLRILPT